MRIAKGQHGGDCQRWNKPLLRPIVMRDMAIAADRITQSQSPIDRKPQAGKTKQQG